MAPQKKLAPELQLMLDDLQQFSTPSTVYWLKDGDTTIKLLLPPGRKEKPERIDEAFYQMFQSLYTDGKRYPYFLIAAVIVDCDEPNVADRQNVRYIKVPKTVIQDLVTNFLAKRWKLFATVSPVVTISRNTKGKASYKLAAEPVDMDDPATYFDASDVVWPEIDIATAAQQEAERNEKRTVAKDIEGEPLA